MIVVSNTSPLTNLAAIDHFGLLQKLFGEIQIAEGVWRELNAGGRRHPGSREVERAPWIRRHTIGNRTLVTALRRDLDLGEAETLVLGLELRASLVLVDEQEGRHAAFRLGLRPLGVLGVLLQAKRLGEIAEVRPLLDALRLQAGFYVGEDLLRQVLARAGEKP
jgi:predicted nucleic acid-binding protein